MRILFGFLIIVAGFFFIWKASWIVGYFGRIEWAEEKLSLSGGTRLFWKLFGLLAIFIGFLLMFNLLGGIIMALFGRSFSSLK